MPGMPEVLPELTADDVDKHVNAWTKGVVMPKEYSYSAALLAARNTYYNAGLTRYFFGKIDPNRIARCIVFNNDFNGESSHDQLWRLRQVLYDANLTPFDSFVPQKVLGDILDGLKVWDKKTDLARLRRIIEKPPPKIRPHQPQQSGSRPSTATRGNLSASSSNSSAAGCSSSTAPAPQRQMYPSSSNTSVTRAHFTSPKKANMTVNEALICSSSTAPAPQRQMSTSSSSTQVTRALLFTSPRKANMSVNEALKAGFTGFDIDESSSSVTNGAKNMEPIRLPVKVLPIRKRRQH